MGLGEKIRDGLKSETFRQVAVTYSGQIVGSGIGFLIQIFLRRQLDPADYGVYAMASQIGGMAIVLTDVGLSHAMIRFGSKWLADEPDSPKGMARCTVALIARLILAVIVSIVGVLTAKWFVTTFYTETPRLLETLRWAYVGLIGHTLFSFWMFFSQTFQKFGLRSIVTVATSFVRAVAFAVLYGLALLTPTTMIILEAATPLAAALVAFLLPPRGLLKVPRRMMREAMDEILPYLRFTGPLIVADTIFAQLDVVMLGAIAGDRPTGLYQTAWTYAMVLGFLNMSVANVLFPKITSFSDIAALSSFIKKALKLTGLLAVATLPSIPFLAWWIPFFETQYVGAETIFYIMYVGLVFDLIVGPLSYALYSLDRPDVLVKVAMIKVALNITGNYLLIPEFGAEGAAWATILTRVLGGIIAVVIIVRTIKENLPPGGPGSDDPGKSAEPV